MSDRCWASAVDGGPKVNQQFPRDCWVRAYNVVLFQLIHSVMPILMIIGLFSKKYFQNTCNSNILRNKAKL